MAIGSVVSVRVSSTRCWTTPSGPAVSSPPEAMTDGGADVVVETSGTVVTVGTVVGVVGGSVPGVVTESSPGPTSTNVAATAAAASTAAPPPIHHRRWSVDGSVNDTAGSSSGAGGASATARATSSRMRTSRSSDIEDPPEVVAGAGELLAHGAIGDAEELGDLCR